MHHAHGVASASAIRLYRCKIHLATYHHPHREIVAAAVAAKLTVRSARVEARFGVPSVAEAAALAAFAGRARLIVPRRAAAGVTVAIAEELPT